MSRLCLCLVIVLGIVSTHATTGQAQLVPDIGYIYPSGGQVGTTVDVTLGGYDWTPDMQLFVHDPRIKLEIIGAPSGRSGQESGSTQSLVHVEDPSAAPLVPVITQNHE